MVARMMTRETTAPELEAAVFAIDDPRVIARSLRRRAPALPTAMSLLLLHIQRVGKRLSKQRRAKLEAAKVELRALFQDEPRRIAR